MKYRRITPSRWHHLVVWAIQTTIGRFVADGSTDMSIERYLSRARLLRRMAFRECAESRHELRRENDR